MLRLPSNAGDVKIPHASWLKNQNIKQKQYCNKFIKDFKKGPHQKRERERDIEKTDWWLPIGRGWRVDKNG